MSDFLKYTVLFVIIVGIAGTAVSIAVGNILSALVFGVAALVLFIAYIEAGDNL